MAATFLCIFTSEPLHLIHPSPTKLEESYLCLTAPHTVTLHIVGAQEELTTLKGEAFINIHMKKGLQVYPQSSTIPKTKQNHKSYPLW